MHSTSWRCQGTVNEVFDDWLTTGGQGMGGRGAVAEELGRQHCCGDGDVRSVLFLDDSREESARLMTETVYTREVCVILEVYTAVRRDGVMPRWSTMAYLSVQAGQSWLD